MAQRNMYKPARSANIRPQNTFLAIPHWCLFFASDKNHPAKYFLWRRRDQPFDELYSFLREQFVTL